MTHPPPPVPPRRAPAPVAAERAARNALRIGGFVCAIAPESPAPQPAKEATAMATPGRAALIAGTGSDDDGSVSMKRHPMLAAVFGMLAVLMPAQVLASGVIGPFPIQPREFSDFAACKDWLEQQHADDRAAAGSTPAAKGRVAPQRSLETKGVVQTGDTVARYDAVLGYLSRMVDEELKAIRSQYSYEKKWYVCNDGMLTGMEQQGYHLETYEPLE